MALQELSQQQSQQQSLYRRHRPRTFADVVGQEPVVRTLSNAVQRGRVHHAYLFVGSRGTGKTSMAKILAACLNCERGPTVEPCGVCDACRSIAAASSLDVIEMDAASNNSVDDIRALRERVAYAPVSGGQKVYILDEAHMLTSAAWNAFLKTLEEPPPNTVFVLATTEAQKVPATVVDRCHRFDFRRPTVEQITGVLRRVALTEAIDIPPEALAAVARAAAGSFRDALGTLEQLVTYSGRDVSLADVLAVLGVTDGRLVEAAFAAIAGADPRRALLAIETCAQGGRDASAFAADLEARARELLIVQTLGEVPRELSLTAESDARLARQAQQIGHETVLRSLELLGRAMEAIKAGADARTQLELALVKAAKPSVDVSMSALLERLERLERAGPAPHAQAPDPPAPQAQAPDPPAAVSPSPAPPSPAPPRSAPPSPAPPSPAPPRRAPRAPLTPPGVEPVAGAAAPASVEHAPVAAAQPQVAAAALAASGAEPMGELARLEELWPAVIELVRGQNGMLGALIEHTRPMQIEGPELIVAFPASATFLKKKAEAAPNRAVVAAALQELSGSRFGLAYELREELTTGAGGRELSEEEWVARFKAELDAEEL